MRHSFLLASALLIGLACSSARATSATSSPASTAASSETSAAAAPTAAVEQVLDSIPHFINLEAAQEVAQRDGKQIMMVFAGSDWCRPCMAFKRSIIDDDNFNAAQLDKLVLVYLDFPAKRRNQLPAAQKAYNDNLAKQYNPEGAFPRIFLLDAGGERVAELTYTGQTQEDFSRELAQLKR